MPEGRSPALHGSILACPTCVDPLVGQGNQRRCPKCGWTLELRDGCWRVAVDHEARRFLARYAEVRSEEGWGADDPTHLRDLPYVDRAGKHEEIWRIRAASYDLLLRHLHTGLRILDLGCGNGWLALRLSALGHRVTALDLWDDARDGMGAALRLPEAENICWIQSSFDHPPLAPRQFDLVLFNGSFHYSRDPVTTLRASRQLMADGGRLMILDSPYYLVENSGLAPIARRDQRWSQTHKAAIETEVETRPACGFLTRHRLRAWGSEAEMDWQRPRHAALGLRWRIAPYLRWALGRRDRARFPLIVGRSASPRTSPGQGT